MVGSSGLEPPTSRLSGARSNQLSYEPILVDFCGLTTFALFDPLPFVVVKTLSGLPRCPKRIGRGAFAAGGDEGIRTHDPLLAKQVLSQLSYTPILLYRRS